ncbi:MAG TPA: hypothetical protein VFN83_02330 [Gemmatimonadales bacterium]|jgi:hypothetical protein|nr:hypothetical protein [Gemmatimonadales bacterium]
MRLGIGLVAVLLAVAAAPVAAQRPLPGRYQGSTQFIQVSDNGVSDGELGLSLAITGPDSALTGKLTLRSAGGTPFPATLTGTRGRDGHFQLRGEALGLQIELEGVPDGGAAIFGHLAVSQGGDPFVAGSWRATRQ